MLVSWLGITSLLWFSWRRAADPARLAWSPPAGAPTRRRCRPLAKRWASSLRGLPPPARPSWLYRLAHNAAANSALPVVVAVENPAAVYQRMVGFFAKPPQQSHIPRLSHFRPPRLTFHSTRTLYERRLPQRYAPAMSCIHSPTITRPFPAYTHASTIQPTVSTSATRCQPLRAANRFRFSSRAPISYSCCITVPSSGLAFGSPLMAALGLQSQGLQFGALLCPCGAECSLLLRRHVLHGHNQSCHSRLITRCVSQGLVGAFVKLSLELRNLGVL